MASLVEASLGGEQAEGGEARLEDREGGVVDFL